MVATLQQQQQQRQRLPPSPLARSQPCRRPRLVPAALEESRGSPGGVGLCAKGGGQRGCDA